ncbi:excalibur calcium-binding domain-containing protein [Caulobacter sp. 17J65-9]|nr:excalibur calcium-binding domain-containing protein [Caulobacter sp. 17J65-9]
MRQPGPYRRGLRPRPKARGYGSSTRSRRWRLTPSRLGFIAGLVILAAIAIVQQANSPKPVSTVQYSYFSSCADARAKGAAPIRQGEAGYRPELDADGDGVACEPYFGR